MPPRADRSLVPFAWKRSAAWSLGLLWVFGACAIDDRALSGVDLGNGGAGAGGGTSACEAPGANACEACLNGSCCEEISACGARSECVSYLTCAEDCAGEQGCLAGCAEASPTGFGDALALGVCSQSQCGICSGLAAPFEDCNPDGPAACESPADCSALGSGALGDIEIASCPECDPDLRAAGCVRCLSERSGLSPGCSSCVADWLACAVGNCSQLCAMSGDSSGCERCFAEAGCNARLASCGFTR